MSSPQIRARLTGRIPVIKNHIMLGLERNRQEVAKLPPKVVDPSSFLHDKVIAPISRELQISFERRRSYAQKLLAPLERLKKNLADSIQSSFPLGAVKVREDKVPILRTWKGLTA